MGLTRRKLRARPLLRKRNPKKKSRVLNPAFTLPPKLKTIMEASGSRWDKNATVMKNYTSFGFLSNPNLMLRSTSLVRSEELQLPPHPPHLPLSEFDPIDPGSDLEEDDLKIVMGKKRRDGKNADAKPLTAVQRYHVKRLIDRHGDNYEEMFRDMKLNVMQFSVGVLKRLCHRYLICGDQNPLINHL